MNVYSYIWEDGTISFVAATSKTEAIFFLDEIGSADRKRLKKINSPLFVTVKPNFEYLDLPENRKDDADAEEMPTYTVDENSMPGTINNFISDFEPGTPQRQDYDKITKKIK